MPDRVTDLGAFVREQRESARLSLRQLANAAGVSNPYLSQIERGLRKPSAEVLTQIAKGLQISAEALFQRAGLLEESVGVEVEVAIQSDVRLTARQKRVLLDIYETFRAENAREDAPGEPMAATVVPLVPGLKSPVPGTDQAPVTVDAGRSGAGRRVARKRAGSRPRRSAQTALRQVGPVGPVGQVGPVGPVAGEDPHAD